MLDNHYEFLSGGDSLMERIQLTEESPYDGVVFQYGAVQLVEESEQLRVKFEYEVFENPQSRDVESEEFRKYVGEILHELILQVFNPVT